MERKWPENAHIRQNRPDPAERTERHNVRAREKRGGHHPCPKGRRTYARHHWTIRKARRGGRTATTIQLLGDDERLEELASMLRGESCGATTRQEAAAMLEAARRCWEP
jgi:translation initiation factor 1 (eIF-1/SUI1)